VSLTEGGRAKIEHLFPRFNAEETSLASTLTNQQQEQLAAVLRKLFKAVEQDGATDARAR
jgi:DNA-binding MarR family transcriptional regulator